MGNAPPQQLRLANVEGATTVIVAIPNSFEAGQAVERCRKANPSALIVARAHSDEEEQYLRGLGANVAIMGEREIGLAMLELVNPETIAAAAASPADAIAAAIAPKGIRPVRTLPREPERALSDIDEDELARAIGVPPAQEPPAVEEAADPPAAEPAPTPARAGRRSRSARRAGGGGARAGRTPAPRQRSGAGRAARCRDRRVQAAPPGDDAGDALQSGGAAAGRRGDRFHSARRQGGMMGPTRPRPAR